MLDERIYQEKLCVIKYVSSYMINYLVINNAKLKYLVSKLYCLSNDIEFYYKIPEKENIIYKDIEVKPNTILRRVSEEYLIIQFFMEFLHEFLEYDKGDEISMVIEQIYFEIDKLVNPNIKEVDLKEIRFYIEGEFAND